MKKIISYILSWSFFWLGHICGKLSVSYDSYFFGYMYQKFMAISGSIQEWGGKGPWSKPE